jgi:carboxyl-terminal processing protease
MLGRLKQSHFTLISGGTAEGGAALGVATVLMEVRATPIGVIVTRVAPASAAGRAGVKPGDRLLSIDAVRVGAPAVEPAAISATEAAVSVWLDVIRLLSGADGSIARLELIRPDGAIHVAQVKRELEPGEPVTLGHLPTLRASLESEETRTAAGKRVGVVAFNVWMAPLAEPFARAIDRFRTADGLVIDLSGNLGGLVDMIRGIAGHVLDEPRVIGRMQMRSALLEFRANPRRSTSDGRRVEPFSGPLAIVVDGLTASASECFAAGLQSLGRARVFGTPTMGQALPALTKSLPNGDVLEYAVGDFVTSTGWRVEGAGVIPDEVVPLDPEALAAGHDGLARALAWIDGLSSPQ